MPTLQDAGNPSSWHSNLLKSMRPRKLGKTIMKSRRIRIHRYEHLPIRIRPWFVVFTFLVMLTLGLLGFTNFHQALPLNDKLLRFLCFGLATGVLYWVSDVEEDSRRIWIWRHFSLIFTGVVCLFFGGIVSEIVQSLLPFKQFEFGDVIANISGSSIGLFLSYHLERRYRHRREIHRLYQPVQSTEESSDSEDEGDSFLPLPTHSSPNPRNKSSPGRGARNPLGNVWDTSDSQEIFAIVDDEEDGDLSTPKTGASLIPPKSGAMGGRTSPRPKGPQIVVTAPSTASGEFSR